MKHRSWTGVYSYQFNSNLLVDTQNEENVSRARWGGATTRKRAKDCESAETPRVSTSLTIRSHTRVLSSHDVSRRKCASLVD
jgi:hypothetical protein